MALLPCIYQLIQTGRAISSPGVTTLREKKQCQIREYSKGENGNKFGKR